MLGEHPGVDFEYSFASVRATSIFTINPKAGKVLDHEAPLTSRPLICSKSTPGTTKTEARRRVRNLPGGGEEGGYRAGALSIRLRTLDLRN